LLIRFFLNPESVSYLRGLEEEFGESTNAIRLELNRFESAGLLSSSFVKNKKIFTANIHHPLFKEIQKLLRKSLGVDQIIEFVAQQLGGIRKIYLAGALAKGKDTQIIELLMFGNGINTESLDELITRTELLINRKIRCLVFPDEDEEHEKQLHPEAWVMWQKDENNK